MSELIYAFMVGVSVGYFLEYQRNKYRYKGTEERLRKRISDLEFLLQDRANND